MATYYIDFAAGNDASSGTSKSAPWKRCPGMSGFSGAYSHQAGDRFIFKGGVTWVAQQCLPLTIAYSGSPGSPDYYGVDKTWFIGGSWSKPKFDAFGAEVLSNGYDVFVQIPAVNPQHDITIDNIDFTGLYWANAGSKLRGWVCYLTIGASTNILIQNCNFRNWSHAPYNGGQNTDSMFCILGYNQSPFTAGCVVQDCLFDGENAANSTNGTSSCDSSVRDWGGKILRCIVRNTAGGLFPSGSPPGTLPEIANCTIGPLYISYDPTQHDDGIQNNGGTGVLIHDNYMFDCAPVPIFIMNGSVSGENDYVWNNVFDFRSQTMQTPISLNTLTGAGKLYLHNNTIICGPGYAVIRVVYRNPGSNVALIDARNNHIITENGLVSIDAGASVTSTISQNNVIQTYAAATAAGYLRANSWKPPAGGATINAGQDLSSFRSGVLLADLLGVARPQGSFWDAGAYEYLSGGPGPAPVSQTHQALWNVSNQVTTLRQILYSLRAEAAVGRTVRYDIAGPIAAHGHVLYNVQLSVSRVAQTVWSVEVSGTTEPTNPDEPPPPVTPTTVKRVFLVYELFGEFQLPTGTPLF